MKATDSKINAARLQKAQEDLKRLLIEIDPFKKAKIQKVDFPEATWQKTNHSNQRDLSNFSWF